MDSNMSAAAFIHRPGGGSSSASSTGTGSSAGGGPGNGGSGGGRVAVIGVTRNVKLRRRGASGFGFSLRGGREYAAGFYVSDVQPGGEADRNGLRVGDQIIRVNGYPVEDAVHQEVALLAKNQQVLVLKIRSVGMIPVKDNPNDPVTWHMVQQHHHHQQQQQQQQPLHYSESGGPTIPYNEVRIRVMVGEKGKLGCGVCRGLVPGLTVQGTRENGPARAAGLKGGDVIIWCNGQQLTDMPFDRAIEVMRSAAILDLIVNRPIPASNGIYDCPETLWMRGSSGYDSESSSLLTASPTLPINHNPPSPQHHINAQNRFPRNDVCGNRNGRACCPLALSTSSCSSSEWSHSSDQNTEWTRRLNNTTVIRVNHNATQNHLNQNQYRSNTAEYPGHPACRENYGMHPESRNEPLYDPVTPRDYESHDFDANPHDERNRRLMYDKNPANYDLSVDERINYTVKDTLNNPSAIQRHGDVERKSITTVDVHQSSGPPAPPCPPPSYKWQSDAKPMISMGKQMGSTMSMGSTGSTETESSLESCGKDSASTSSSLSTSSCEPVSTIASNSTATTTNVPPVGSPEISAAARIPPPPAPPISSTDLSSAIAQELQRRAQQRSLNARKLDSNKEKPGTLDPKKPANPEALRVQENKVTHDKLMEEFKRAHQKMFNGNQQKDQSSDEISEKEQPRRTLNGTSSEGGPPPPPMPLPVSTGREDAVEMQSIESFKLKESPSSVIPKPPPTYFSSSPTSTPSTGSPRHSAAPTKVHLNGSPKDTVNNQMEKMAPKVMNGSTPCTGKVAVRIGAYEGETKQPSRLDFLPSQSRTVTDSAAPTNGQVSSSPVVSKLQNELAATLQRSNLKKKTDSEIVALQSPTTLVQGNVEKLAAALSNKVTIKVSPENGQR